MAGILTAGPYASCVQGVQINLMKTEALNAWVKFQVGGPEHIWLFSPKLRTGNCFFNSLYNKDVQTLEVVSNEWIMSS